MPIRHRRAYPRADPHARRHRRSHPRVSVGTSRPAMPAKGGVDGAAVRCSSFCRKTRSTAFRMSRW